MSLLAGQSNASPSKPQIVNLTKLSNEHATFFGKWMAKAFYRVDGWALVHCGISYAEDPDLHELFLDLACCELLHAVPKSKTTTDFKTVCMLYRPGVERVAVNFDYRSGNDAAWDEWTQKAGGRAAIEARRRMEEEALYGAALINHYRYGAFAVHPDLQGKGIGRFLHEYNMTRARDESRLLIWGSCRVNYGFYEKCGSRRVGREVKNYQSADAPSDYEAGCQYTSVMQN